MTTMCSLFYLISFRTRCPGWRSRGLLLGVIRSRMGCYCRCWPCFISPGYHPVSHIRRNLLCFLTSNSRRMMMTSGSGVNYKSMFDAGSQIIAKEGTKSLFKGAGANILRGVAGAGVLSLYDKLQQVMFGKVYSGGTRFLETTTSKRLKCLQDLVKLSMLSHTIDLFRLLPSFWCGYSIPRRFVAVDKCIMAAMDSFNSKPCGRVA